MVCIWAKSRVGVLDGNTLWDVFIVGRKPILTSGPSDFYDKIIREIEVHELSYDVVAEIYFEDGSFTFVDHIAQFYKINENASRQGTTPDIQEHTNREGKINKQQGSS